MCNVQLFKFRVNLLKCSNVLMMVDDDQLEDEDDDVDEDVL